MSSSRHIRFGAFAATLTRAKALTALAGHPCQTIAGHRLSLSYPPEYCDSLTSAQAVFYRCFFELLSFPNADSSMGDGLGMSTYLINDGVSNI